MQVTATNALSSPCLAPRRSVLQLELLQPLFPAEELLGAMGDALAVRRPRPSVHSCTGNYYLRVHYYLTICPS